VGGLEAIDADSFQDCRCRKVFFSLGLHVRPHLCVVIYEVIDAASLSNSRNVSFALTVCAKG
jgi:hypothetical protein